MKSKRNRRDKEGGIIGIQILKKWGTESAGRRES